MVHRERGEIDIDRERERGGEEVFIKNASKTEKKERKLKLKNGKESTPFR